MLASQAPNTRLQRAEHRRHSIVLAPRAALQLSTSPQQSSKSEPLQRTEQVAVWLCPTWERSQQGTPEHWQPHDNCNGAEFREPDQPAIVVQQELHPNPAISNYQHSLQGQEQYDLQNQSQQQPCNDTGQAVDPSTRESWWRFRNKRRRKQAAQSLQAANHPLFVPEGSDPNEHRKQAALLTRSIMSASSPANLQQLLEQNYASVNAVHVSAMLKQLVRLGVRCRWHSNATSYKSSPYPSNSYHKTSISHPHHLSHEQQQHHANPSIDNSHRSSTNAYQRSKRQHNRQKQPKTTDAEQVLSQLCMLAADKRLVLTMGVTELASIMSSLAALQAPINKSYYVMLLNNARQRFDQPETNAWALVELLYAAVKIGMHGLRPDFAEAWCTAIRKQAAQWDERTACRALYALARLNVKVPNGLTEKLLSSFRQHLNKAHPQDLSNVLWAAVKLRLPAKKVPLGPICRQVKELLPMMDCRELSVVLWSLLQMKYDVRHDWKIAGVSAASRHLLTAQGHSLALLVYSMGMLKWECTATSLCQPQSTCDVSCSSQTHMPSTSRSLNSADKASSQQHSQTVSANLHREPDCQGSDQLPESEQSSVQVPRENLQYALDAALHSQFAGLTTQGMCMMLYGAVLMKHHPDHTWLTAFYTHLNSTAENVHPAVSALLQESFSVLGFKPAQADYIHKPNQKDIQAATETLSAPSLFLPGPDSKAGLDNKSQALIRPSSRLLHHGVDSRMCRKVASTEGSNQPVNGWHPEGSVPGIQHVQAAVNGHHVSQQMLTDHVVPPIQVLSLQPPSYIAVSTHGQSSERIEGLLQPCSPG